MGSDGLCVAVRSGPPSLRTGRVSSAYHMGMLFDRDRPASRQQSARFYLSLLPTSGRGLASFSHRFRGRRSGTARAGLRVPACSPSSLEAGRRGVFETMNDASTIRGSPNLASMSLMVSWKRILGSSAPSRRMMPFGSINVTCCRCSPLVSANHMTKSG